MVDLIGDLAIPYALIQRPRQRMIGTIIPDVTIEEVHHDELVITDHPVEIGSTISDHAFMRPVEVQMRVGWSDSTEQSVGFVQRVYEELRILQGSREPFNVSTGKRSYKNMLIASLAITTDKQSEFALSCVAGIREVIITSTSGGSGLASNSAQSDPAATGGVQQLGTQQLGASGLFDDGGAGIGSIGGLNNEPA